MRRFWLILATVVLFVVAWTESSALQSRRIIGIFPINPPTPYIHYSPPGQSRGRVLVVHGLDASKETMQILSAAIADGGFDVFVIDLPGHGDSPARFEASFAEQAIGIALDQLGNDTIVVGHSLGAGLLLDLAQDRHFATLVLLAPPPVPAAKIQADRILAVSGVWDVARIRAFAPIVADIGSPQVESWTLSWAAHSSAIFHPVHVRHIVEWLGGDAAGVRTLARLAWLGLMLAASVTFGACILPGRAEDHRNDERTDSASVILVRYVAACGAAILVLRVFNPLSWLRLFTTDYLIAFVFLSGIFLWVLGGRRPPLQFGAHAILKAIAAAVFVILVIGFGAVSHILHMGLSDGRWWRFPIIAAAGFPLFAFDQRTMQQLRSRLKEHAVAVVTRALLWAFLLIGVLILNRQDAFLFLIAHLVVMFWIALWFAASLVYRHTKDPIAAGLFAAIVQGWAFAAWFVTT